jgi:cell wall-associated NlpC family hydrolase
MAEIIFQVSKVGAGFQGPGTKSLKVAIERLGRKLQRLPGPYQLQDDPNTSFATINQVLAVVEERAPTLKVGQKVVVMNTDTGRSPFALRKWEAEDSESPLVTFAKRFVGKSPYLLGAEGPPGKSDCSSLTMNAVKAVHGVALVHKADTQMRDDRIRKFRDASKLKSGDFVFLNYGRLPAGQADHVEFFVKPGQTLGSRGSTNGVGFYNFGDDDASCVLNYGRMK